MKHDTRGLKTIAFILGIILFFQAILGIANYFLSPNIEIDINPTSYEIEESSKPIEHLWTRNDISSFYFSKGAVMIDSTETDIYFLGRLAEENPIQGISLIKFNLLTGEIVWRIIRSARFREPMATGLTVKSDQILMSFRGTTSISGETLNGAAKLRAYDTDGDTLWSRRIPGARSITTMAAINDTISVDGSSSSNYYMLDANNGKIVNTTPKDDGNFIWFIDGNIKYEQIDSFSLQAVDTTTDTIIWQNLIDELIYVPPLLSDNYIIIRTREARSLGTTIALNQKTGEIVWEHSNILSNVVVDQQIVYFLTEDMQLIGADIHTGDVLVSASFSPNEAVDSVNNVYQIAAEDGKVVIYFGGTHQLSAYDFSATEDTQSVP